MICPHCNAQLPDDAHYCRECGGDVTLVPARNQQAIATTRTNSTRITEAEEKDRNTKIGIAVVASIGVLAIVCLIIAIGFII